MLTRWLHDANFMLPAPPALNHPTSGCEPSHRPAPDKGSRDQNPFMFGRYQCREIRVLAVLVLISVGGRPVSGFGVLRLRGLSVLALTPAVSLPLSLSEPGSEEPRHYVPESHGAIHDQGLAEPSQCACRQNRQGQGQRELATRDSQGSCIRLRLRGFLFGVWSGRQHAVHTVLVHAHRYRGACLGSKATLREREK